MFPFKMTPDDDGEPLVFTATRIDVMRWEEVTPGAAMAQLSPESTRLMDLYAIAWHAAKRLKLFDGKLAEFKDLYQLEVEGDGDDAEDVDPTPAAP